MNTLKTTVLLAALTGLIVGIAHLLGETYGGGNNWALMALIFCGVMNFVAFWFSDAIVLRMYKAREVGPSEAPKLYRIVENLANRARMPMPKVYVIPTNSPNAFATGRGPSHASVAATEGIMRLLNDAELEGVMAHELAHVKNRDTLISTVAATLGGAVSYLSRIMMFSGGRRDSRNNHAAMLLALVAMILAPLVAAMIQMAISRGREYVADRDGALICGNPNALASALERLERGVMASPMPEGIGDPATAHMCIVNSFGGTASAMAKLFSTHPPMEERIRRLREMRM